MIDIALRAFVLALHAGSAPILDLERETKQEGLFSDWAQAMWEVLVEVSAQSAARKKVRLVIYGDGADCHGASSRFSCPEDEPTHQVRCNPKHEIVIDQLSGKRIPQTNDGYALDRFVCLLDGWYFEKAPFDHALIEHNDSEYVVALKDLEWQLVETSPAPTAIR